MTSEPGSGAVAVNSDSADGLTQLSVALERTVSWIRRTAAKGTLSTVALSSLDALVTSGPLRVTELAAREQISQPGMTGLVTRLAEAGLVERRPDPSDGRAAMVAITAAGREHLRLLHAERTRTLAARIGQLSARHQRQLQAAVDALTELTGTP